MTDEFDADGYLGREAPIGPRMALALWCAAVEVEGRAELEPMSLAENLPPAAWPSAEHEKWMAQLADCFRVVRRRLGRAAFPLARCTGDEFALHTIISAAAALDVRGLGPDPAKFGMQVLPEPNDDDFVAAHLDLFEDSDLLVLFDPLFDGIDDPESEINKRLGIGPYLHPSNWFTEFPGYAGFDPLAPITAPALPHLDDDVLEAAADLATRSGARAFSVTRLASGHWVARAGYRGVELTGSGEDADSAATDLVRRVLSGGVCPPCGRRITIDPYEQDTTDACVWERAGNQWRRGCQPTIGP